METILLNINTNDDYFERVIHNEMFQIIEKLKEMLMKLQIDPILIY